MVVKVNKRDKVVDREKIRGSRIMKIERPRAAVEKDYGIDLIVSIHHAEAIDNPSFYTVSSRVYNVVFWVDPEQQYETKKVLGLPDPSWNWRFQLFLNKTAVSKFLHVEVIRYGRPFDSNPGTSTGIAVVGRARIPLPELFTERRGRYGLVRLEGSGYKGEGHIILTMESRRLVYG